MITSNVFRRIFLSVVAVFSSTVAYSTFYQSVTMAEYCREYVKFIDIQKSVNQYEAGICAGFVASTIELMDLSERLCKRGELNLDNLVKSFVEHVDTSEEAKKNSATFVLVDVLQTNHSCDE